MTPEPGQNGLLPVRCWRCQRVLMELEPGATGWAVKACPRCKRRNLVDLVTGQTGR
jgi:phage FluMu protein Com